VRVPRAGKDGFGDLHEFCVLIKTLFMNSVSEEVRPVRDAVDCMTYSDGGILLTYAVISFLRSLAR